MHLYNDTRYVIVLYCSQEINILFLDHSYFKKLYHCRVTKTISDDTALHGIRDNDKWL